MGAITRLAGRIFGTEKALEATVNGAVKGLDALIYTDEERAQAAAENRSEARKMVVAWMQATSGQNLARRCLALIITGIWVLQYFACMALNIAAVWSENPAPLQKSAEVIGENAVQMNGAMMLILGFYFAAPHMGAIVEAAFKRFGSSRADSR